MLMGNKYRVVRKPFHHDLNRNLVDGFIKKFKVLLQAYQRAFLFTFLVIFTSFAAASYGQFYRLVVFCNSGERFHLIVNGQKYNDAPQTRVETGDIAEPVEAAPAINPVSIFSNQGEDALRSALSAPSREALVALVAEHNLDPAGQAEDADRNGLIEQIVSQAKKRVERDSKLFDY